MSDQIYKELQSYKLNDLLTQKRRQQLRANCHELRELERQLQSALILKELEEQQQNIVLLKEKELLRSREENAKFVKQCELLQHSILQQECQEKQKKVDLEKALKHQISLLQENRRIQFEDVKKDHDEMDKLVKQIESDNITQRKEAEMFRENYRKEIEDSIRDFKLKQKLENEKDAEVTQRNLVYQKECDNLKTQLFTEKKQIQREKDKISERIGQQLGAMNHEKEKREQLFSSLLGWEQQAKDDERFRYHLVNKVNERDELRKAMVKYRRELEFRKEKQFVEDEKIFRQERLRCLEERDKLEQLSDKMRRRKRIEHNNQLRAEIDIRRRQEAETIAAKITDYNKIANDEKKSNQLVENERIRMLRAVPKELLSYLPHNVLKPSDKYYLALPDYLSGGIE